MAFVRFVLVCALFMAVEIVQGLDPSSEPTSEPQDSASGSYPGSGGSPASMSISMSGSGSSWGSYDSMSMSMSGSSWGSYSYSSQSGYSSSAGGDDNYYDDDDDNYYDDDDNGLPEGPIMDICKSTFDYDGSALLIDPIHIDTAHVCDTFMNLMKVIGVNGTSTCDTELYSVIRVGDLVADIAGDCCRGEENSLCTDTTGGTAWRSVFEDSEDDYITSGDALGSKVPIYDMCTNSSDFLDRTAFVDPWNPTQAFVCGAYMKDIFDVYGHNEDSTCEDAFSADDGSFALGDVMAVVGEVCCGGSAVKCAGSGVSITSEPTPTPSAVPTAVPTPSPSNTPTRHPTPIPTLNPTADPTFAPTPYPTTGPGQPSNSPTPQPSAVPTAPPTVEPSAHPTFRPTRVPTLRPTRIPTAAPTSHAPTFAPTLHPTTGAGEPSNHPTPQPSASPTTAGPTSTPTSVLQERLIIEASTGLQNFFCINFDNAEAAFIAATKTSITDDPKVREKLIITVRSCVQLFSSGGRRRAQTASADIEWEAEIPEVQDIGCSDCADADTLFATITTAITESIDGDGTSGDSAFLDAFKTEAANNLDVQSIAGTEVTEVPQSTVEITRTAPPSSMPSMAPVDEDDAADMTGAIVGGVVGGIVGIGGIGFALHLYFEEQKKLTKVVPPTDAGPGMTKVVPVPEPEPEPV